VHVQGRGVNSVLGHCGHVLDRASVMVGDTTCSDCRRAPLLAGIRAAEQSKRQAAADGNEWSLFIVALRQAARDGIVHQNDVRPLIRGRIYHKHIGPLYTRAKAAGVLVELHREQSEDGIGRNTHHASGVYRLGAA